MRVAVIVVVALAACASPESAPSITKLRPPWGPMTGGTTVEVYGDRFDLSANRVFIGGREASVVRTIDDRRLEIVIPPGEHAGDAEIVVVTPHDNAAATGLFRYSAPPVIESVTPAKVILSQPTTITVRGSGFVDEEAGATLVMVGGQIVDAVVRDDSRITFEAPPGVAFTRADIELLNQRGRTNARGYLHALTDRPGLLAFNLNTGAFARFYDPTTGAISTVPYTSGNRPCIYGVIGDGDGTYWASDYCVSGEFGFGRIDLGAQALVDTVVTGRLYPAMARHRGTLYAVEYSTNRFGTLAPAGDSFTQVGTATFSCCDYGLASDGTTMWLAARDNNVPSIRTIDPDTGEVGASVSLTPAFSISDLRWLDGTLYATTTNGNLVTIDPATGTVTTLGQIGSSYALEVLE